MNDEQTAVWNRAVLERGGKRPRGGDAALGALLVAHVLVMNGGVLHAVRTLSSQDLAAACDGFRFFGFEEVAALLAHAAMTDEATDNQRRSDAEYARAIPTDIAISERFERHFVRHRRFYAPQESR